MIGRRSDRSFGPGALECTPLLLVALSIAGCGSGNSVSPSTDDLPPLRYVTSDSGTEDRTPCFSPDGELLLFERRFTDTDRSELFVVPVAGGAPRPLTASPLPVRPSRPSWSRHVGDIAFTGLAGDGRFGVWLIAPDGSGVREVLATGLSDEVLYPAWYQDGRHMVVVDFGGGEGGVIKRIDTQRGVAEPLTDRRDVLAGMPSVSPNGKAIAFAGQKGRRYLQERNRIWLLDRKGVWELDPRQGRTPAWSPDGKWVAFESDRGSPDGSYAVFVVPRDGGRVRQVTPFEINANHPKWSPDGQQIAFSARSEQDEWRHIALVDFPF